MAWRNPTRQMKAEIRGAEEAGQRVASGGVGGVCVIVCQHWSQGVGLRGSRGKAALSSCELVECSGNIMHLTGGRAKVHFEDKFVEGIFGSHFEDR